MTNWGIQIYNKAKLLYKALAFWDSLFLSSILQYIVQHTMRHKVVRSLDLNEGMTRCGGAGDATRRNCRCSLFGVRVATAKPVGRDKTQKKDVGELMAHDSAKAPYRLGDAARLSMCVCVCMRMRARWETAPMTQPAWRDGGANVGGGGSRSSCGVVPTVHGVW